MHDIIYNIFYRADVTCVSYFGEARAPGAGRLGWGSQRDLDQHPTVPLPWSSLPDPSAVPMAGLRGRGQKRGPRWAFSSRTARAAFPAPFCSVPAVWPRAHLWGYPQLVGFCRARLRKAFTRPRRLAQACSPSRLRAQRTRPAARPRQGPPAVPVTAPLPPRPGRGHGGAGGGRGARQARVPVAGIQGLHRARQPPGHQRQGPG